MTARRNLAGLRFGRLLVLEYSHTDRKAFWRCRCDCGQEKIVRGDGLCDGTTKSCGCLQRELAVQQFRTHGHTIAGEVSRLYQCWLSMKQRCENPKNKRYKDYGALGIKPIASWSASFEAFLADVIAGIGLPPAGMSLDRIDNARGYEPRNIRWASASLQNRNKRSNRLLSFGGRMISVAEATELTGIGPSTIIRRLNRGWSDEEACALSVRGIAKMKGKDRA